MTDREFKRLTRVQLIEIIYQLQLKLEEVSADNQRLKAELMDKRVRMDQVGNLADAVLEINHVMQAAQRAAEQYLEEIHQLRVEAENDCRKMLEEAQREADRIVARAKKPRKASDTTIEAIMEEFDEIMRWEIEHEEETTQTDFTANEGSD